MAKAMPQIAELERMAKLLDVNVLANRVAVEVSEGEELFGITREQARRLIKQWCDDCGLKGRYGTHTMRKTFATVAYDNSGGDPVLTARITGHSNPSQLMAYIGRKPATERKVWDAVGASFS